MKSISKISAVFAFIILLQISAKANMASPQLELLSGVSTISSRQIDILHEDLKITLAPFFNNVFFNVHYRIRADKAGKQIPLLFVAESYRSNFIVEVDGKPVEVLRIPETFYESGRLMDYNPPKIEVKPDEIYVDWPVFEKVYKKKTFNTLKWIWPRGSILSLFAMKRVPQATNFTEPMTLLLPKLPSSICFLLPNFGSLSEG